MPDFIVDLLLPKTDHEVAVQWIVMGAFWLVVIAATWRQQRDIRHFVWGLAMLNLGWFAARMIH